jgi:nucleoid DNA-binding protein
MTKTQLAETLSQRLGHSKSEMSKFMDGYAEVVAEALKKEGTVTVPGLVKLKLKDTPATPAGERMNPFTKQMAKVAAKPASKKVKVTPLAALKKSVV